MKALVINEKHASVTLQEKPDLQPSADEVIVQVKAAAINHRDVWIQKGQYAGLKYPITPGSDGAGIVVNTGNSGSVWMGKEVLINPAFHWGNSPTHQHPTNFSILGLPEDGTLAEYVKVPVSSLITKPAHLSFEEAAAIPVAGVTAYRALFTRAGLQPGEKVLITGIGGGVALFALQYAVALGAKVYVSSGSDEKLDKAVRLGASGGVNYTHPEWSKTLQELAGSFDVIIDGAAGDGMDDLLNVATAGGRLAFYGATRGNPSNLTARRIFWKQLTIFGSTMGSPEDFKAMLSFIAQHQIHPIIDKIFPFAAGEAAFRWMDNAQQFGKIIISIP